ncbi:MAG: gluconokinase [Rhizobiaceae bacterium]|nr:gluconokinase [Rhizobiaceae bacterium]
MAEEPHPLAVVVMGVAGSGKSLIGRALAERLGAAFVEGDEFHTPGNIALMASGTPLTDQNREGWLDRIGGRIAELGAGGRVSVTACSALKRAYRDRLRSFRPDMLFVYLSVDRATAERRVAERRDHFMPPSLVESQFLALDAPGADERALEADASKPREAVLDDIESWLFANAEGAALTAGRSAGPLR